VTSTAPTPPQTLHWEGDVDGHLKLIDQTRLPGEYVEIECRDVDQVWESISVLRVRGAPAIGIAAAYGACLGVQSALERDRPALLARMEQVIDHLATSRPTAVNLFWALKRMRGVLDRQPLETTSRQAARALLDEALAIHEEDRQMCRAIGRYGAAIFSGAEEDRPFGLLTHCNAGGLATSDYGTALAVMFTAHEQGRPMKVYVDETRPLLQGARLTAWELMQHGIPCTLICDSMAAQVMREGRVQAVVTGADRIAANGDTANKIGTYAVALLAAAHEIPFYVAAPSSTFDLALASGDDIPIEQREASEITNGFGRRTAPEGVEVYNPAFDVTPARLIRAIVTERGLVDPVNAEQIRSVLETAVD
jgi:methylthioribose-1-phosphate isomerase